MKYKEREEDMSKRQKRLKTVKKATYSIGKSLKSD